MRNSGNTRPTGLDGERRAADFYEKNGYQIVGRNFRTRFGEIDLIAQKGETLVFSEVKALPSGNPEILAEELGQRKRRKIVETAKYFLKNHRQYSNKLIRFDAVVIDMPGFESVRLIENAFSEN